jgi:YesN/AraC family two-component response regulator
MFKVLIVDDEKQAQTTILEKGDWTKLQIETPCTAANGHEALCAMRELHPDLVLTDVVMPEMDGFEFLKIATQEFPETRFIIISGYAHFSYAKKAIHYGALDYLLKPVDEKELNQALLSALRSLSPDFSPLRDEEIKKIMDADRAVEFIHAYIDKNYTQNIRISMFSEQFYFSKEYLARQFKARYHCGIYEYALQKRMERARELLRDPNIRIQDVARRVGYEDNNYFSKAFRSYYGISPSAWRQYERSAPGA